MGLCWRGRLSSSIKLSLIVARSRNGAIGVSGKLPWHLADDLAFFKQATLNKPIIMGRRTWESLPKRPLPKRDNIVLTRDWAYQAEGGRTFSALRPAIEAGKALARAAGEPEVFVVGGEALYKACLPLVDLLYITEVDTEVEGDAFFPDFEEPAFDEVMSRKVKADAKNDHDFTLRVLKRKT